MGNPEASSLVRFYRRLLPHALRRWLVRIFPADTRLFLQRCLAGLGSASRGLRKHLALRFSKRLRRDARRTGVRLVWSGRKVRAAEITEGLTASVARATNLLRVCEVLERHGIPHFCVRGNSVTMTAVAVPASERPRAERALRVSPLAEGALLAGGATGAARCTRISGAPGRSSMKKRFCASGGCSPTPRGTGRWGPTTPASSSSGPRTTAC